MIGRIYGKVVEKTLQGVIVDVGGVGYEVALTTQDLENCQLGEPTMLYTYFHVRENSQELFGFKEIEAKKLFELLTSVSGIGPKMGMSILSLGDQKHIRQAIAGSNINYLVGASGVGKRLAERVAVDLKDKVGVIAGEVVQGLGGEATSGDDAVDALLVLGYTRSQAVGVLSKIDPSLKAEDRIRQALKEI